jgi:uncharacterized linocin/CFP29 family protein
MATPTTTPLTAHLAPVSHPVSHVDASHPLEKGIHLGRERVKWSEDVWDRIDRAVHHEFLRTSVVRRILPHHKVDPHVTTVPADTILSSINGAPFSLAAILAGARIAVVGGGRQGPLPNIDEAATTRLIEISVDFSLTAPQVEQENKFNSMHHQHSDDHAHLGHDEHSGARDLAGDGQHPGEHAHPLHPHYKHHAYSTAVTLATRAANVLAQAHDAVIAQGQIATAGPFFTSNLVNNRGVPGDYGLLAVGPTPQTNLPAGQVVAVPSFAPIPATLAVQIITIFGATGGTFTLTYGGNATGAIAWSNNNATLVGNIVAALTAPPVNIPAANISVTPGALTNGNGTIQVTFLGAAAAAATAITAASALAPATATVSVGVPGPRYVENTVRAIDTAYSILQAAGHYGPYAAVLYFYPYADSYAPLPTTLILPADRIRPLMTEGYLGTGSLPGIPNPAFPPPTGPLPVIPNPTNPSTQSMGVVLSTGGNSMDLVIGQDPITAFSQLDPDGNYLFRVLTRFALRLKDPSAVIRLEFQ